HGAVAVSVFGVLPRGGRGFVLELRSMARRAPVLRAVPRGTGGSVLVVSALRPRSRGLGWCAVRRLGGRSRRTLLVLVLVLILVLVVVGRGHDRSPEQNQKWEPPKDFWGLLARIHSAS